MDIRHAKLISAMTEYDAGDTARIQHFIKVHDFAAAIAVSENRQAPIMPSMRMHVSKLVGRCSSKKLTNALDRCADLDRLAKGLTVNNRGDVWAELRSLCIFLAHVPNRN